MNLKPIFHFYLLNMDISFSILVTDNTIFNKGQEHSYAGNFLPDILCKP